MDVKVSLNNAELAALEVALARANSVRLDGIHMKQLVQIRNMLSNRYGKRYLLL